MGPVAAMRNGGDATRCTNSTCRLPRRIGEQAGQRPAGPLGRSRRLTGFYPGAVTFRPGPSRTGPPRPYYTAFHHPRFARRLPRRLCLRIIGGCRSLHKIGCGGSGRWSRCGAAPFGGAARSSRRRRPRAGRAICPFSAWRPATRRLALRFATRCRASAGRRAAVSHCRRPARCSAGPAGGRRRRSRQPGGRPRRRNSRQKPTFARNCSGGSWLVSPGSWHVSAEVPVPPFPLT